ncbi:Transmembrane_domain-containing protein [Hexamita inflata]|uniref:Transmembrane_domain-containing protein n=1 Tax=Hexamita inflata TaxID=28002 RepID=A0ABP1HJ00_9EUKA
MEKEFQTVQNKEQFQKASPKHILKQIHQFINPDSYSEQGARRVLSIDVLRGIAIFCTCFIHEVSRYLDENMFTKLKMPIAILGYIIGAPSALFSQWRSFFTLICGMTYGYLGNDTQWSIQKSAIECLKRTMVSIIQLPMFFFFNCILVYVWSLGTHWEPTYHHPFTVRWFEYQMHESAACWFYGLTFCFMHLIAFSANTIARLFSRNRKIYQIMFIRAAVYCVFGAVVSLITNQIQVVTFQMLKRRFPSRFENVSMLECPTADLGDYFSPNYSQGLFVMFITFWTGPQCYVFPMWTNLFFGCMIGCFIQGVVQHRKLTPNNRDWMRLRKRYLLLFGFSFVIPLILWGFQSWLTLSDIKVGRRTEFQSMKRLLKGQFYLNCYMPELLLFDDIFQFLAVFAMFLICDSTTKQKSIVRTNKTLYLRRLSTGSLTCYVFSTVLGGFIRGFFSQQFDRQNILQFYGFEIVYFIMQLFLMIGLDYADWMFTPDWIVNMMSKGFQCKYKCGQFAKGSHLKVQNVNVFEKVDEYNQIDDEEQLQPAEIQ